MCVSEWMIACLDASVPPFPIFAVLPDGTVFTRPSRAGLSGGDGSSPSSRYAVARRPLRQSAATFEVIAALTCGSAVSRICTAASNNVVGRGHDGVVEALASTMTRPASRCDEHFKLSSDDRWRAMCPPAVVERREEERQ
jgi:hypothetical protein